MKRPWIRGKNFHNFHWTKTTSSRRGHEKLQEEEFHVGGLFIVFFFLGKGRKRMMSFSRWWKEGKWVRCLGYFEIIEVSRIVLRARNFRGILGLVA
jgi:hypothetical protein